MIFKTNNKHDNILSKYKISTFLKRKINFFLSRYKTTTLINIESYKVVNKDDVGICTSII